MVVQPPILMELKMCRQVCKPLGHLLRVLLQARVPSSKPRKQPVVTLHLSKANSKTHSVRLIGLRCSPIAAATRLRAMEYVVTKCVKHSAAQASLRANIQNWHPVVPVLAQTTLPTRTSVVNKQRQADVWTGHDRQRNVILEVRMKPALLPRQPRVGRLKKDVLPKLYVLAEQVGQDVLLI